jgi:hypothetical protein
MGLYLQERLEARQFVRRSPSWTQAQTRRCVLLNLRQKFLHCRYFGCKDAPTQAEGYQRAALRRGLSLEGSVSSLPGSLELDFDQGSDWNASLQMRIGGQRRLIAATLSALPICHTVAYTTCSNHGVHALHLMSKEPELDVALMDRVKRGDTAAFTELVDKYKQPVMNFVARMLGIP